MPLVFVAYQETLHLRNVLGIFLTFLCHLVFLCVSLWTLPRALHPLTFPFSVPCLLYCNQFSIYRAFHFSGISLTMIAMPVLNCFTNKPNVDFGNVIWHLTIFPVNSDGINYCLKYFFPSPMISHMLLQKFS